MKHKILSRYPLGNTRRLWRQDNLILSTFSARSDSMRDSLEACRDAGYNLAELGWAEHGQAEEALRLCEELSLPLLYQDFSLFGGMQGRHLGLSVTRSDVKAITDHVRPYTSCIGYYVWDEPYVEDQLREARRQVDLFQAADPARLPFTVAIPSYNDKYTWQNGEFPAYLERYVSIIDPPVLSLDYYPVGLPLYTDEKQLDDSLLWCDLGLMRRLGRAYGLPLWFYYQGVNLYEYHRFTFPMVRMNMYAALLYGCKGLQQFTAVGALTDETGAHGSFFEEQTAIHNEIFHLGNTLMALESRLVLHSDDLLPGCPYMDGLADKTSDSDFVADGLPERVSVGELCDTEGNTYLMILNRDYETDRSFTVALKRPVRVYTVSKQTGRQTLTTERTDRLTLSLDKGDAVLLRVQPADEEPFTIEYRLEK